jgi:hypothetical protein
MLTAKQARNNANYNSDRTCFSKQKLIHTEYKWTMRAIRNMCDYGQFDMLYSFFCEDYIYLEVIKKLELFGYTVIQDFTSDRIHPTFKIEW